MRTDSEGRLSISRRPARRLAGRGAARALTKLTLIAAAAGLAALAGAAGALADEPAPAAAAAAAAPAAPGAPAADQAAAPCPGAEAVLERAAAAQGDPAALARLRNRLLTGRMEIPAFGLTAPLTVYKARPNLSYGLIESEQLGRLESGTDGETWWENSTMQGPRVKQGSELAASRRDDDFDGLLNWRRWFAAWDCVGAAEVEGRPAWKLALTVKDGGAETWCFDQETGLPVRAELTVENEQGKIPVEITFLDYRPVDGAMVSFTTRQVLMGGVQTLLLRVEKVEHNVELPAGRFALPDEVRALRDKLRETPAGQ